MNANIYMSDMHWFSHIVFWAVATWTWRRLHQRGTNHSLQVPLVLICFMNVDIYVGAMNATEPFAWEMPRQSCWITHFFYERPQRNLWRSCLSTKLQAVVIMFAHAGGDKSLLIVFKWLSQHRFVVLDPNVVVGRNAEWYTGRACHSPYFFVFCYNMNQKTKFLSGRSSWRI